MRRNEFHLSVVLVSLRIFHNKTLAIEINFVSLYPDLASRVAQCPPTGLWRFACRRTSSKNRIVGSGGKAMRVNV